MDLGVHLGGGVLGAGQAHLAVQVLVLDSGQAHDAEFVAHAVHGDHLAGQVRGALDIVGSAGGHGVEGNLFRGAAAQHGADLGIDLVAVHQVALFLGGLHGVAQGALGVGHDGDLLHGLGALLHGGHQGVAHLVVGDQALFLFGQHGALLFGAGDDGLKGDQQVFLIDGVAAQAHGAQGGFVDQVCQVRADAAGGGLGDLVQVYILAQADVAGMHLKRGQAAGQVWPVHGDAPVEAAGTQQGLVQHLGAVGGAKDDDALAGVKAVQLAEQLVEGLLAFIVAAEFAGVAALADGVDLVDKDDAGGDFRRFLEQVAHAGSAYAHEHFHKIGAGDGEEGDLGFAGHSLGEQCLAGAGGAHQQRALGQLCADGGIFSGVVEEVDDLLQAFLGFVLAGYVCKGDAGGFFHVDFGVGLAHVHHAAHAAFSADAAEHEQRQQDDEQERRHGQQHAPHRGHFGHIGLGVGHVVGVQQGEHCITVDDAGVQGDVAGDLVSVLVDVDIALHRRDIDQLAGEGDGRDLVVAHHVEEIRIQDLGPGGTLGAGVVQGKVGHIIDDDRQKQRPCDQCDQTGEIPAAFFLVFIVVGWHRVPPLMNFRIVKRGAPAPAILQRYQYKSTTYLNTVSPNRQAESLRQL